MGINFLSHVPSSSPPPSTNYDLQGQIENDESTLKKTFKIAGSLFKDLLTGRAAPLCFLGSKSWSIWGCCSRVPYAFAKRYLMKDPKFDWNQYVYGSGYHRTSQRRLNREEAKAYMPFFAATAFVHANKSEWVSPFGYEPIKASDLKINGKLPGNLKANGMAFYDPDSRLKMVLMKKENELVLTFGALHSWGSETGKQYGPVSTHKDILKKSNRLSFPLF